MEPWSNLFDWALSLSLLFSVYVFEKAQKNKWNIKKEKKKKRKIYEVLDCLLCK